MPIAGKAERECVLTVKIVNCFTQRRPHWRPDPDLYHAMLKERAYPSGTPGGADAVILIALAEEIRAVNRDKPRRRGSSQMGIRIVRRWLDVQSDLDL